MSEKMMKAARFFEYGEPSVLKYMDFPMPEVGDHDVLIRVKATSINRFDLKMRRGQIPQIPGRDPFPIPFQPGRDVAGEIAEIGRKVIRFKVGDRVVGMTHPACGQCANCLNDLDFLCTNIKIPGHQSPGGYAEYVSRREWEVLPAPERVSYEKLGSCLWTYACVWNVVSRRGELKVGQSLLITGASGGMGTAAIQLSRMVGASPIIATTGSPTKEERLKELGVNHVVNYRDTDTVEQVKSFTNGAGVDLVMDFVGGEMFVLGLNCLRVGGTIVNIAGEEAKNAISMHTMTFNLIMRYIKIIGVRGAKRVDNQTVLRFLSQGLIDPVIDRVMPLSEAAKAHEILERQEHIGKIVLVP